ncbi:MAG: ribonuclease III [Deltaproteobacteria bacterium]|nr:MAG: ribonuclease III [Deltaproteobacteria bacterium]
MNERRICKNKELENKINHKFKNTELIDQALTHKSYIHECDLPPLASNERLEFLGDAVLGLIIGHELFKKYPGYSEGELSILRAAVVNERQLARIAREIDLGSYLLLGKGEEQTGGRNKDSLLADAYEAILGAIYLDGGIEGATNSVLNQFSGIFQELIEGGTDFDFKSRLQEITQDIFKKTPNYSVINEWGPDHEKSFEVQVLINDEIYSSGIGKSKKDAEQKAAAEAIKIIQKKNNYNDDKQ